MSRLNLTANRRPRRIVLSNSSNRASFHRAHSRPVEVAPVSARPLAKLPGDPLNKLPGELQFNAGASAGYLRYRTALDQLVALLLLVACSPVLIVLYLLVRMTSSGPAIYTQQRVGLEGRVFTLFKFRSMTVDAECGTGAVWSQPGDPRVTPVGRFLRWSHLDELLQLINIVRGDMVLIGPRPERPEIVEKLQKQIPGYRDRLKMLPGVTGLAQVSLPPDSNQSSVERKTIMDRQYIETASPSLDIHILFCTVMMVFGLQRRMDAQTWQAFA